MSTPNTTIDESRKAIEKILVKNHLPEKPAGQKLWGEYIDVVLDLESLINTAVEEARMDELEDIMAAGRAIDNPLEQAKARMIHIKNRAEALQKERNTK